MIGNLFVEASQDLKSRRIPNRRGVGAFLDAHGDLVAELDAIFDRVEGRPAGVGISRTRA